MATYIIGDLQGCYKSFTRLLNKLNFSPSKDIIWCVGDLINRGDDSLATLRLIYKHRNAMFTVLGNHDLHLLSTYFQRIALRKSDTFLDIILAPDAGELLRWLQKRPMCHYFESFNLFLSHAGLYPGWSIQQAISLGQEVQHQLCSTQPTANFFAPIYGSEPSIWNNDLKGADRTRFIVNALTRMRTLTEDLALNMGFTKELHQISDDLYPWFNHPTPLLGESHIAFGHWSALQGTIDKHTNGSMDIFALDTGCVWNGPLTALHLETQTLIST